MAYQLDVVRGAGGLCLCSQLWQDTVEQQGAVPGPGSFQLCLNHCYFFLLFQIWSSVDRVVSAACQWQGAWPVPSMEPGSWELRPPQPSAPWLLQLGGSGGEGPYCWIIVYTESNTVINGNILICLVSLSSSVLNFTSFYSCESLLQQRFNLSMDISLPPNF